MEGASLRVGAGSGVVRRAWVQRVTLWRIGGWRDRMPRRGIRRRLGEWRGKDAGNVSAKGTHPLCGMGLWAPQEGSHSREQDWAIQRRQVETPHPANSGSGSNLGKGDWDREPEGSCGPWATQLPTNKGETQMSSLMQPVYFELG
ncbi:hypothetical protein HJG60_010545 [Phyllostomus discolor]|uniref:Uncharacterized protein n=1 Tax=Phyllostomus discolor TaxID=89673 RepID=A0A834EBB8_9CHIR|nr:hypothetical protein HJG60_010545 [Phyllostomus discolor]